MDETVARLLAEPASATEHDLAALDDERRRELILAAKASIDERARSDPPSALPLAELLARVPAGESELAAVVHRGRATAFHSNGKTREALDAYLQALEVYESTGEELEVARVLRSLVDVYQMSGRPEESLALAERAREILVRLGEERLLAQLETNVGNVYVRMDDYPRARASYLSACERLERNRLPLDLAISRYNLAIVESQSGLFAEAERTFDAARSVFHSEGMHVHVADCLYVTSLVQARRGDFAQAISGLEEARKLYSIHRKPRGVPLCDLDLAEIYLRLDARREAVEYAERAARGFEQLELDYELAKSLTLRGVASLRLGEELRATEAFGRARGIFERIGNAAWSAIVGIHEGELLLSRLVIEPAVEALERARTTLLERGLVLWADLAAVSLVRALVLADRHSEAERALDSLLEGRDVLRALDAVVLGEALRVLAELRHRQGDLAGARDALRRAVEAAEGVLGELPRADIRIAFFRRPHGAYVDLARLLCDGPDADPALGLEVLESGRFRSLRRARRSAIPRPLAEARERLSWLLAGRLDAAVGTHGGNEDLGAGPSDDDRMAHAEADLARVLEDEGGAGANVPLAKLRDSIRDDETVVAYALSQFGTVAWVLDRRGLECVPIPLDSEELERLRRRWFFQVGKLRFGEAYSERHRATLEASAAAVLEELGRALLEPVLDRVRTRSVVVVPYGALHGLPFHAFRVPSREDPSVRVWAADELDVTYGLSIAHLAETRQRAPGHEGIWLCGARDVGLPSVREELGHIRSAYGSSATEVPAADLHGWLLGPDRGGGLLHLASHGVFRPENPVLSALLLGDCMLTARDLDSLDLGFDLVTLSGCETGKPHVSGGEEAFGIAYGFVRAGARAVLCSLWPVRDRDSCAFMREFYGRLAEGEDARGALAGAQRSARAESSNPVGWSAFVLLGAPDVRAPRTS